MYKPVDVSDAIYLQSLYAVPLSFLFVPAHTIEARVAVLFSLFTLYMTQLEDVKVMIHITIALWNELIVLYNDCLQQGMIQPCHCFQRLCAASAFSITAGWPQESGTFFDKAAFYGDTTSVPAELANQSTLIGVVDPDGINEAFAAYVAAKSKPCEDEKLRRMQAVPGLPDLSMSVQQAVMSAVQQGAQASRAHGFPAPSCVNVAQVGLGHEMKRLLMQQVGKPDHPQGMGSSLPSKKKSQAKRASISTQEGKPLDFSSQSAPSLGGLVSLPPQVPNVMNTLPALPAVPNVTVPSHIPPAAPVVLPSRSVSMASETSENDDFARTLEAELSRDQD